MPEIDPSHRIYLARLNMQTDKIMIVNPHWGMAGISFSRKEATEARLEKGGIVPHKFTLQGAP